MTVQIDDVAVSAAFSQPDNDGTFPQEFAQYLDGICHRRPVVLLPFAPKAAGTFLRSAIVSATGGQLVRAVHAQGGRDAQLYLPVFIRYYYGDVCEAPMVVHAHMQGFPANLRFIEALDLNVPVMIRSISDMLASMWDMFLNEPAMRIEAVNCIVPDGFADSSDAQRADYMMDMFAPWYVSYFASWLPYAVAHPERVLLLRYSELLQSPASVLGKILAHAGLPKSESECTRAMNEVWDERKIFRFNRGVNGRGRQYFSAGHLAQLKRMISHYGVLDACAEELL